MLMDRKVNPILAAVAAFAGGFAAGLLFAPESGRALRRKLASQAEAPTHWVGGRLHEVERQLTALEKELRATSAEFSEKLRETTQRTMAQYVPDLPDDPEAWHVESPEVARELRGLPR